MTTSRLIGQQSVFTATFRNDQGSLVDPATVTFMWRVGSGVETSYVYGTDDEVTRSSTGVYQFTAPTFSSTGPHFVRAKSDTPVAAVEDDVVVGPSAFAAP